MNKIARLPEHLINQIAAGEVVERPASVVKELLENSIDAGAMKIVLTVRQGGIGLIRVSDDGMGMSPEDAILALERHATSKIRSKEDLQTVKSMGFRGEALASIASVSHFTLRTRRTVDAHGIEINLEGGKLMKQSPVGCAPGTEIIVESLFYNALPRLKFLKSEQTEYQNILDTVINLAMAFPQIAFKLVKESFHETNPNEVDTYIALDLPATNDLLLRIRGLFGKAISDDLVKIYYSGVNLAIHGYIGKPQLSRANRSLQYFFVNSRPINSHVLSYAVKQAYHSLLPKERHPVFAVFFELDPSMVDVNCHPRKTEVKFQDEREIYRALLQVCGKSLEKTVFMPVIKSDNINYYQDKLPNGLNLNKPSNTLTFNALSIPETVKIGLNTSIQYEKTPTSFKETTVFQENSEKIELIPLGQLDNSFILCQKNHDLVIIDQHAAHERIRYNVLICDAQCEEKVIQPLLVPLNVELSPADSSILNANKAIFDDMGIKIEHFGGNTFSIAEIPSYLVKTDLKSVLLGLIDDLKNLRNYDAGSEEMRSYKGDFAYKREKALIYLACRSAVKFGDPLTKEEIISLINQLNQLPSGQMTCPHGRPIMIALEKNELLSRFGRKYDGFFEKEDFHDVNC